MFRRLANLCNVFRRRPATWLALLGQFVALFGLPLPSVSGKDASNPFPCQQRKCGCMCAADCWNHCCCFSARERLAWARQHCVPVPQSLVKQAKNTATSKSTGCCDLESSPSHLNGAQPGGTLGFLARQCHGEHTLWGCGEPAPVPAPIVQWSFDACCVDWCLNFSWRAFPLQPLPPDPPPRG